MIKIILVSVVLIVLVTNLAYLVIIFVHRMAGQVLAAITGVEDVR